MSYPSSAEQGILADAEELMVKAMARYDPSHDAFHVQRVRRTAMAIAKEISFESNKKLDFLTIELAALLHDVLDKKFVSADVAGDPFTFFLPFFQKVSTTHGVDLINDGRAHKISRIVDNISWATEKKLADAGLLEDWHRECVELHCVQDADRLDAIGAFGIMRCAAYSVVSNRPLHAPPSDPAHVHSAIHHFHEKLLHIRDRLKTRPGRSMGETRHNLLVQFLASVEAEYSTNSPSLP